MNRAITKILTHTRINIDVRLTKEKNIFYARNRWTKRNSPFEGG